MSYPSCEGSVEKWKRQTLALCCVLSMVLASTNSLALADESQARDILRRAIAAVGGEARLNTLKAPMMWMERGTFHGGGQSIPFVAQYASQWPDLYRYEIENAFAIGIRGDRAFLRSPNGDRALTGGELKEQVTQARVAWALFLFPLQRDEYALDTVADIEIDGRAMVGISASHPDGRDAKFYFDRESYLLTKIETVVITPQTGPDPVKSEAFYSDHASFGGVLMPSKYRLVYDGNLFVEGETVDVKVHATIDHPL